MKGSVSLCWNALSRSFSGDLWGALMITQGEEKLHHTCNFLLVKLRQTLKSEAP